MESQVAASDLPKVRQIPISIPDDVDIFLMSGEILKKLENVESEISIPIKIKLISIFITLIYRYQEEEETKIHINVNNANNSSQKPVELSVPVDANTTMSVLFSDIKNLLSGNEGCRDWLYSSQMSAFSCTNLSDSDDTVKMSLQFEMSLDGNLVVSAEFMACTYDVALKWDEHFRILTESIISDEKRAVSKLPMLSEEDYKKIQKLSTSLIDIKTSMPECLHMLFKATVEKYPQRAALRCKGIEMNYEEFNEKANALAFYLQLKGVKAGDHIAILLPRSVEIFISIMGILKAGAAYVPIDPRSPEDRIKFILEDSHVVTLITELTLYKQNCLTITPILVENYSTIYKDYKGVTPVNSDSKPEDTAYIIYTSGTTGKPKGVVIPHCSVCNLVRGEHHLFHVNSSDRVYQGFSVSFDASVEEMWLAWYSGALLVAATKSEALSGPDLINFLQKENITVFSTVQPKFL
jgi:non-ribosomal peptide synthetase component F